MATLQKIRNRAGLLIIVIGVALLAFIIGDGLRSGSTFMQLSKQVALKIDGKNVRIEDYARKLQSIQQFRELRGQMSDLERINMNNQLAQEYVTNYAMKKIAGAVGIQVTPAELSALIYGEGLPQHYSVAQFLQGVVGIDSQDPSAVAEFLKQLDPDHIKALPAEAQAQIGLIRDQWGALIENLETERTYEKFNALMARSYAINDIDAKYLTPSVTRDVAVVRTASTILPNEQVKVTDQDITNYYNSHKENFRQMQDETLLRYISVQVTPSAEDYAKAEAQKKEVVARLSSGADFRSIARNYDNVYAENFYLTENDLQGYPTPILDFIKSAEVGAVYDPTLYQDTYTVVKLTGKKQSPVTLNVSLIALDSTHLAKRDSIVQAINSGASFAEMAAKYSIDEQSKANGGQMFFQDPRTGMETPALSELGAAQYGIDTLFRVPVGQAIKFRENVILLASEPGEIETKYQIHSLEIPALYSEKTFDEKYAAINKVFASEQEFPKMMEEARSAGLNVVEKSYVSGFSATIDRIPSSREVVSWALGAKKGEVHNKIFRCGNDHLVIAQVVEHLPVGYKPLTLIKDEVKDLVTVEKRGAKLAENLKAKKLSSLAQYAVEMQSTVDTLFGVNAVITGAQPAQLNAHAMAQKLQTLSQPFVAGPEVMVLQPIREEKQAVQIDTKSPSIQQQRAARGRQLGQMAIQEVMKNMKIKDNRHRFY